jgi:hypothetical protein
MRRRRPTGSSALKKWLAAAVPITTMRTRS